MHIYTKIILLITNFADILIVLPHEVIFVALHFQSMKHELLMLRKLMLLQPWLHKKGTSERGDDWEKPVVSLNAIPRPQFRVTQRSVRDHYSTMEKRRKKKVREEERASGIAPEEDKELDQLLNEISELFDESDKVIDETKQKQEEETKKAEEMRKRSLETFKDSAESVMNWR